MAESDVALVLEGGGFRGMFTAGVLDVLQEQGIYGFSGIIGTSAGALNAANFRSRQHGRVMRTILAFRDDKRFMSLYALATTGSLAGNDFLYHEIQDRLDPFDCATFNANPVPVWAAVTDVVFGTPDYLEVSELPRDIDRIRASASLPVISDMVEIGGHLYLDGGTTDAVPVEVALDVGHEGRLEGYEPAGKALVVLTRERTYLKTKPNDLLGLAERRYADYHYYLTALRRRPETYNLQRQHIWELERAGKALVICPPGPVEISTTEHSGEKLLGLYLEGRREATARLDQIRAFLG